MRQKIYFIRHAKALDRTDWNAAGKSDFDRPLKEKGIQEFTDFSLRFSLFKEVQKIYSSEFVRAEHTAKIIHDVHGIPYEANSKLNHRQSPRDIIVELSRKKEHVIGYTGHEPELSNIMKILMGDDFKHHIKKGAVLLVDIDQEPPVLELMTSAEEY